MGWSAEEPRWGPPTVVQASAFFGANRAAWHATVHPVRPSTQCGRLLMGASLPRFVTAVFHSEGPVARLFSSSRVDLDFKNLLERMRQRAYPDTVAALAYFWLRTVYVSRYDRGEWNHLDGRLSDALNGSAR